MMKSSDQLRFIRLDLNIPRITSLTFLSILFIVFNNFHVNQLIKSQPQDPEIFSFDLLFVGS